MKRTAAILAALLVLSAVLPAAAAYAASRCAMPCHPAPAACHHRSPAPAWAVKCDCHHPGDEQLPARVESNPLPVNFVAAVPAPLAVDRLAQSNSDLTDCPFARASIYCLTRSYRI